MKCRGGEWKSGGERIVEYSCYWQNDQNTVESVWRDDLVCKGCHLQPLCLDNCAGLQGQVHAAEDDHVPNVIHPSVRYGLVRSQRLGENHECGCNHDGDGHLCRRVGVDEHDDPSE